MKQKIKNVLTGIGFIGLEWYFYFYSILLTLFQEELSNKIRFWTKCSSWKIFFHQNMFPKYKYHLWKIYSRKYMFQKKCGFWGDVVYEKYSSNKICIQQIIFPEKYDSKQICTDFILCTLYCYVHSSLISISNLLFGVYW